MNTNFARSLRSRARSAAANPREALALLLIIVMPGGFFVPVCYAVYHAVRQTLRK